MAKLAGFVLLWAALLLLLGPLALRGGWWLLAVAPFGAQPLAPTTAWQASCWLAGAWLAAAGLGTGVVLAVINNKK